VPSAVRHAVAVQPAASPSQEATAAQLALLEIGLPVAVGECRLQSRAIAVSGHVHGNVFVEGAAVGIDLGLAGVLQVDGVGDLASEGTDLLLGGVIDKHECTVDALDTGEVVEFGGLSGDVVEGSKGRRVDIELVGIRVWATGGVGETALLERVIASSEVGGL
jgi:hypothetical protein